MRRGGGVAGLLNLKSRAGEATRSSASWWVFLSPPEGAIRISGTERSLLAVGWLAGGFSGRGARRAISRLTLPPSSMSARPRRWQTYVSGDTWSQSVSWGSRLCRRRRTGLASDGRWGRRRSSKLMNCPSLKFRRARFSLLPALMRFSRPSILRMRYVATRGPECRARSSEEGRR